VFFFLGAGEEAGIAIAEQVGAHQRRRNHFSAIMLQRRLAMPEYRTIAVSRHGAIIEIVKLQCANDEDAKKQALALAKYNDVELWQGERQVALIKARHT